MSIIKTMSNEQLIEVWEMTENMTDKEIPTVRGWLMDEIENRFPEAFNEWLDSDYPADKELRNYIMK